MTHRDGLELSRARCEHVHVGQGCPWCEPERYASYGSRHRAAVEPLTILAGALGRHVHLDARIVRGGRLVPP